MVPSLAPVLSAFLRGSALSRPMIGLKTEEAAPAFSDKLSAVIWRFLQEGRTNGEIVSLPTAAGLLVVTDLLSTCCALVADLRSRRYSNRCRVSAGRAPEVRTGACHVAILRLSRNGHCDSNLQSQPAIKVCHVWALRLHFDDLTSPLSFQVIRKFENDAT